VDKEHLDNLKALHIRELDARNGYEEALVDAEGKGLSPLFLDMVAVHDSNAGEIGAVLLEQGEEADSEGSFMSVVNRTIMNVRSLFSELDESVLPGLIDGEKRNLDKYDEALKTPTLPEDIHLLLTEQRDKIQQKVALMELQRAA
jgi:uncharacterized protein (TIGR02284 family)